MPVRRIERQRKPAELENAQAYESAWMVFRFLSPGGKHHTREEFHDRHFASTAYIRRFYAEHRAEFDALQKPCERHALWWLFTSPAPRDEELEADEQLFAMGVLLEDEIETLKEWAAKENAKLHDMPWHNGLAFRRSWRFWQFVSPEPRDESISEFEQLKRLKELTSLEREIIENPIGACQWKTGRQRTRFYYLTKEEREAIGFDSCHSEEIECPT
jgi:hypothetical protein